MNYLIKHAAVLMLLVSFTFSCGVVIGEHTKGGFFRSWDSNDPTLYAGDRVRFRNNSQYVEDRNSCKIMVILDIETINNDKFAWVLLRDCAAFKDTPNYDSSIIPIDSLKKE
jgi:hypothetical protein